MSPSGPFTGCSLLSTLQVALSMSISLLLWYRWDIGFPPPRGILVSLFFPEPSPPDQVKRPEMERLEEWQVLVNLS
jgi:hypothetical protein